MHYEEVTTTREFVGRLDHGADWRTELEEFAAEAGVTRAAEVRV